MDRITNWKARRSGARITIQGTDGQGADVRLTDVQLIHVDPLGRVVATTQDGGQLHLVVPEVFGG